MTSPNTTFTELSAITYRKFKQKFLADNVSNHTALYNRIAQKGNVKTTSGGTSIQIPLDYAENSTYQRLAA